MHLPIEVAEHIVEKILEDLTDRKGLRQEWEKIDAEVQEEIKFKWVMIVENFGG